MGQPLSFQPFLAAGLAVLPLFLAPMASHAQAEPTAERRIDLTAFTGITSTFTGLSKGHNGAVTAGFDLNLPEVSRVRPSIEVRGVLPFSSGTVVTEKSVLGGVRAEARLASLHPYVDFLAGPGQITFVQPYQTLQSGTIYRQPATVVLSPGLGVRIDLPSRLSLLGDLQFQRWGTPASLSGHLFAKPLTVGLVYRFPLTSSHAR